jgi:hypothetical protein
MASKLLGRALCPVQCGNAAAHVKIKTDKAEGKAAFPYVHCPACGAQLHTKSDEQAGHLLALTRPEKGTATATLKLPEPTSGTVLYATPTPTPTPRQELTPTPARGGLSRPWNVKL